MAKLATETWTGANGAAWPAQWNSTAFTAVTPDIQANAGRIRSGTAAFSSSRAFLSGAAASTDTDLTATFTFATQAESYLAFSLCADNTGLAVDNFLPQNGYMLQVKITATATAGTVGIYKLRAGGTAAETDASADASILTRTVTAGTAYKVRWQRISNVLRWKLWAASAAEPATWDQTFTDTGTLVPAGRPLIAYSNGSAATQTQATLDNLIVTDGVAAAAVASLTDDFATKDTAKWFWDVNASVVSGQVNLAVNSSYNGFIYPNAPYDLTNSALSAQVIQAPNVGNGSTELHIRLKLDANNFVSFVISSGALGAYRKVDGTQTSVGSVAYSAATVKYVRIRHNGTSILWEYSANGTTWTQLGAAWTPTFPVAVLTPELFAGYYGTEPTPGTAILDNVNILPMAALTDDFATQDTTKWTYGAAASVVTGQASLANNSSFSGQIDSAVAYDATNSSITVEIPQVASSTTGSTSTYLILWPTSSSPNGDNVRIRVGGGTLQSWWALAGTQQATSTAVTYSAANHRWWRISHNGTNVITATSPDRTTWTTQGTFTPSFALTKLVASIGCGGGTAGQVAALVDNVNVQNIVDVGLSGSGTLTATAVPLKTVSASLSGSGALSATGTPKLTASPSLTGSGALAATVVHVAAAALSGSGTLTADFGALAVNANLTGSGTLTASIFSIVVSPNLTGAGTLTATYGVVGAYNVALSGSGDLTAVATPKLSVTCALGGDGVLAAPRTSYRLFGWIFRTPTQEVWFPIAGRALVGKYDQGLTVYRVDGQWRTRLSPGTDELSLADRSYQGGYLHRLSAAEVADLTAGGFADNITYEEVMA